MMLSLIVEVVISCEIITNSFLEGRLSNGVGPQ